MRRDHLFIYSKGILSYQILLKLVEYIPFQWYFKKSG